MSKASNRYTTEHVGMLFLWQSRFIPVRESRSTVRTVHYKYDELHVSLRVCHGLAVAVVFLVKFCSKSQWKQNDVRKTQSKQSALCTLTAHYRETHNKHFFKHIKMGVGFRCILNTLDNSKQGLTYLNCLKVEKSRLLIECSNAAGWDIWSSWQTSSRH